MSNKQYSYVIKRADGLYMTETIDFISNELTSAMIFYTKEQAQFYIGCKEDCKVVKIEICEVEDEN